MSNVVNVSVRQLQASLLCAADSDVRYYLNGVYVESSAGVTRTVGTDGHMLIAHDWKHGDRDQWQGIFIIPRSVLDTLKLKVGRDNYDMVQIVVEEPEHTLRFKDVCAKYVPVDGSFPDYTRVFPSTLTHGEFWNCPSDTSNNSVQMTNLNARDRTGPAYENALWLTSPAGRVERLSEALNEAQRTQQFAADKYVTLAKIGKVFSKSGNFRMWHYPSDYGRLRSNGGAVVTFEGVKESHSVACIVMPLRDNDRTTPPVVDSFRARILEPKKETESA